MPLVGLGTWQMTGARCQAAVRSALEVGYCHIDTATMYRNEREVGRAVRDRGVPRAQVFVTTKLPPGNAGRERRTLEGSLRALGMDYVDLRLVHLASPSPNAREQSDRPSTWQLAKVRFNARANRWSRRSGRPRRAADGQQPVSVTTGKPARQLWRIMTADSPVDSH
jgi:diketogulonate reductase-like aldo/keto reductase